MSDRRDPPYPELCLSCQVHEPWTKARLNHIKSDGVGLVMHTATLREFEESRRRGAERCNAGVCVVAEAMDRWLDDA